MSQLSFHGHGLLTFRSLELFLDIFHKLLQEMTVLGWVVEIQNKTISWKHEIRMIVK